MRKATGIAKSSNFDSSIKRVSQGHWKQLSNQRTFFDQLGNQLGIRNRDEWYNKITKKIVRENGGGALLNLYNGSVIQALKSCYPEHNWIPWKFKSTSQRFWKSIDNQKQFFDWLGKELGVQTLDDWYSVLKKKTVDSYGGNGLLNSAYGGSAIKALMTCYPNHNWAPWKFNVTLHGYWQSTDNLSSFISALSEKLCIQTLDDWYLVDMTMLQQFGALGVIRMHGGLYNILQKLYPDYPWDAKKFIRGKKAQRWLIVTLKKMFPNEEIIEDFQHSKISFQSSKRPVQLDVFIPSQSIAFEYQGIQHFQNVHVFQPKQMYQQRDEEKRQLCNQNNIKLVEVPYWWDRTQESLQKMIDKVVQK